MINKSDNTLIISTMHHKLEESSWLAKTLALWSGVFWCPILSDMAIYKAPLTACHSEALPDW